MRVSLPQSTNELLLILCFGGTSAGCLEINLKHIWQRVVYPAIGWRYPGGLANTLCDSRSYLALPVVEENVFAVVFEISFLYVDLCRRATQLFRNLVCNFQKTDPVFVAVKNRNLHSAQIAGGRFVSIIRYQWFRIHACDFE